MKNLRQEIKDQLSVGLTRLVRCVRITRQDGQVFRFTEHDNQLEIDKRWNGSEEENIPLVIYTPEVGILPESAITYDSDGKGASVDLEGALDGVTIERKEIAAGIWDNADVKIFRTIWDDPAEDDVPDFAGKLGKADPIGEIKLSIRMVGLSNILENDIGESTSVTCRAQLGDNRCRVRLDPPTWSADTSVSVREPQDAATGSVVKPSIENGRHFKCVKEGTTGSTEPNWDTTLGNKTSDSTAEWQAILAKSQTDTVQSVTDSTEFEGSLGFRDDWFGSGTVKFVSGENAGIEKEVESYSNDIYKLWVEMPFSIKVGDEFVATAGCRKRFQEDCIDKFDNNFNNRAEPFAAGPKAFNKFGGQQ